MDHQAIIPRSELERILFDESVEPKALPLSLLEHITSSFSEDKEIGYGGFATVYKGMLDNGTVAVKKLFETVDIDEKKFSEEVRCLMKVKHRNIVRFIGYCSDTQGQMVDCEGKLVLADVRQRLLCFEYLPKGSLDKQITDASCGLEWRKRYQIIHGICDGLYYLHQNHIVHLDLKPANILLDDNMMPKIADFGLSRCFDEKQSRAITSNMFGTLGYMAPEFYTRRQITFKLDIYSLGMIIIEILTGEKGYADIDNVLESWRSRLEKSQIDTQLVQVRVCTEIAIECTEFNPAKRPDTQDIIDRLGATQNADEFAAETGASSGSSVEKLAVVPPGPTIGHENTMANVLKKSAEELYNMTNRNQRFSSMLENSSNVQQLTDMQETASDVEEILMIGRTEQKQKILATLSGTITQDVTVLPIYGIGGIGKTTVARLVFNDSQFVGYSRVWVYVSQKLDLDKIGNSIISQLSGESHIAEKQMIHDNLRKLLAGKKILIVLDDVWEKNPDTLKALKAMLRLGVGSMVKIIVTTRDEAIAWKICHTVEPYKLEITDKICWKIIKQKTAFKNRVDKKQLKHIGKEIATKCGGVVLAAQSIGYTLNGKTSDEWESMRDNYIWNISTSEDPSSRDHEVHASLLLSYRHMPECLKLCFSYCAVFPKGHNIAKYDLIHQWIALGFTESSTLFDPMQLSEKYVTQLLEMSFLQYSKTRSSDGQHDKDVTYFTMHDLVHDLAREILADQVNKGSDAGNRCCYALLTDCSKPFQLSVSFPANIKALRFLDCGKLKLRGDAFPLAKCLHVLDLSECFILKLPGSISRLKQLRFLHAPRIKDRVVPNCITELSELNYLNLRDSRNISALPDSIGGMKGLMHLDLSGCKGIRELPTSFAELKQLVHLNLTNCRMSISEAFGGFTRLQYLNLSEILPINAKHTRGLPEIIGNLITLRYLNLSRCMKVMAPSPSEDQIHSLVCAISTLPNLEHLNLSHNAELSTIPESISNLKKLHTLDLSGCYHLKKIPDCIVKMVNLKVLTSMWGRSDKFALSQSTFAWLPNFVVHTSSDKFSSNIGLLQHTNPDELTIDRLENVTSAEEAQSIKLIEKPKIKVLKFQWNVTARRFVHDKEVLEKLVPPSSVQVLHIAGYRSVSIPDWLMGIRQYLPNLGKIYLCDFPKCSMLPPLGQLPNLWSLIICRMEGLEEWDTACTDGEEGTDELMFPKLVALSIRQCAKLKLNENSWELTRLQTLSLSRCGSMTSLPQWLGGLASLKKLKIEHCEGIRSLPDSIQELTKLEYLIIHGCPTLVKWCELTENKMKLALIKQKFLTNAQEEEMQTSL